MYEATLLAILTTALLWRLIPYLSAPQLVTPEGFTIPGHHDTGREEWEMTACFKKDDGGGAPDPDEGIKDAAYKLGEIGQSALDFYKQLYEEGSARQDVIDEVAKGVAGGMLDMAGAAKDRSEMIWDRYVNQYMPVADKLINDSMNWDSAENQAAAAAQAKADVNQASAQQQAATARQQQAMGVDPTSGAYQSIESQEDTQAALNAAGAQNAARTQKQQEAVKMRAGVTQLGMQEAGLAGQQAGQAGNLGSLALNSMIGANQGFYQNAGLVGTGLSLGMKGYQGMGDMLLREYNAQLAGNAQDAANMAAGMAGLGSIISGAGTFFSPKKAKEDKNPWMAYSLH